MDKHLRSSGPLDQSESERKRLRERVNQTPQEAQTETLTSFHWLLHLQRNDHPRARQAHAPSLGAAFLCYQKFQHDLYTKKEKYFNTTTNYERQKDVKRVATYVVLS